MTYLATAKTINTLRFERKCEHCAHVVTSLRRDGLSRAYRKHLQKHHPAIFHETGRKFRQYPANSTPPELPAEKAERPSVECPYCHITLSSVRASLLPGILTRHKRNEHEALFIDEISARNRCVLDAVQAEPLVSVRVAQCYYPKSNLSTKYPAPKTVLVPERWHVESVFVHCAGDGRFTAYRGAMGSSESWGVG